MIIRSAVSSASRPGMLLTLGLIVPSFGIDGEQDGAFEAVMLGEDLAELRQRFLGAIFFVAADEDDVFALAGPFGAFVHNAGREEEQPTACK